MLVGDGRTGYLGAYMTLRGIVVTVLLNVYLWGTTQARRSKPRSAKLHLLASTP